ncbi:flagellar hook-basal body complex protein FliE [Hasllibacter halocynthiae]|uniref:flagellar hook-basal body complex protein FliE n=1 Tax=Hasllibacter halocynthiae TaxID=595589 RepID=UPI000D05E521
MDLNASAALRGYAAALREAPAAGPEAAIGRAADGFARTVAEGERAAVAAMTGRADPQAMVEALARTQLAVESVVAVRNKVVEAYQEILRMPV